MGRKLRCFTLLELFLSLGLIALVGSLTLLKAKPLLDHYRLSHGYEKLKREIALSKHLAQTATADVEFHIEHGEKGLVCTRKTDEPLKLPGTIHTSLLIPYVQLEGSKKVILFITSSGWIEEDSILTICLGKQSKTIDINLFSP